MNTLNQQIKNKIFRILSCFVITAGILTPLLFITQPVNAAACATPSPSYGSDTMTDNVSTAASNYTIWVRIKAPSASSNQILLQIDTSCFTVGGSSGLPVNSWTWVDSSSTSVNQISLTAGSHTFKLLGNKGGVVADRLELISGTSCTPQNTGDNCIPISTPTPPPTPTPPSSTSSAGSSSSSTKSSTSITASSSNSPVISGSGVVVSQDGTVDSGSASLTLTPNVTDTSQISKVQYFINNKLVYTATKSPFTYKVNTGNLTNGRYTLTAKTFYLSGQVVSQTETVVVKHTFWRDAWLIIKKYSPYILTVIVLAAIYIIWRRKHLRAPDNSSGIEINLPPETPAAPTNPVDSMPPVDQPPAPTPTKGDTSRFPWR